MRALGQLSRREVLVECLANFSKLDLLGWAIRQVITWRCWYAVMQRLVFQSSRLKWYHFAEYIKKAKSEVDGRTIFGAHVKHSVHTHAA